MFERRHPKGTDNAGTYSVYLCIHGEDRDNACCATKKIRTTWAKNSPICRTILDIYRSADHQRLYMYTAVDRFSTEAS